MTKSILVIIYFLVACITAVFAIQAFQKKDKIALTLRDVLTIAAINCFCYCITLITNDYFIMSYAFSFVFISTICLTYFLIKFAIQFTSVSQFPKMLDTFIKWFIIIDAIILLINPFYEISITYQPIINNGDIFLLMIPKFLFNCHLGMCYLGITYFVYLFCKKIWLVSDIYRKKYLGILVGVLLIVIINAAFIFTSLNFDISIIGFALMASLIYYFSFYYFPKSFINQVNNVIISNIDTPIFMFDSSNECIYRNDESINQFPLFDKNKKYNLQEISENLHIFHQLNMDEKTTFEARIHTDDGEKDFIITYTQLYDLKQKYIGSCLILQDTTIKNKLLLQLHNLAYFDPLTGIYNQTLFNQKAREFLVSHSDQKCVIIKFDIQGFKHINEILGDTIGDTVLCTIAQGMNKFLPKGCVFGKAETDHFTICMIKDDQVFTYMDQIFAYLKETLNLVISIIPSIGIYEVEDTYVSVSQMCDWANLASHTVKGNYMNHYAYYQKNFSQQLWQEQEFINDLQDSLDKHWFQIYIQPQYHHETKKVIGGEVLARWIHPKKGLIPAAQFIPVFEKNGFIAKLDEYIWEQTCFYLRTWMDEGLEIADIPLAVNISRADFYYLDVEQTLLRLTEKYNIPRNKLALEITESAYASDLSDMISMVERLQGHGFIVEMDDFGSGYSSLALLKDLPVNVIKLDMNFLSSSQHAENSQKITQAVIQMLHSINMPIIVEGVETKEQADFVSALGCHTIQGFYYSRPTPVEDYIKLIME